MNHTTISQTMFSETIANEYSSQSERKISINSQLRIQFIPTVTKGSVTKGSVTGGSITKGPKGRLLSLIYEEDDSEINIIYPSTK